MRRRDGSPLWIADAQQPAIVLRRADLGAKSALGHYDEAWLQTLLHCHPEIFPVTRRGSVKYDMDAMRAGRHCGACHLNVAFPLSTCQRCHAGQDHRAVR